MSNSIWRHQSQRGFFAYEVHEWMKKDKNIWVITGDLGYKMWDKIRDDFPDRFVNAGASEQAMLGLSVGLALEGKIPIVYSITAFLLYRPFETIRNYLDYEKIPVKLVGSGRGRDYENEGFSHWADEDKHIMKIFKNVKSAWPETKEEIPTLVAKMLKSNKPWYINLKR